MEANKVSRRDGSSGGPRFLEELYRHDGQKRPLRKRLKGIRAQIALEVSEMHFALALVEALLVPVPAAVERRLRPVLYRRLGMRIGRSTVLHHPWRLRGMGKPYKRVTIGEHCLIRDLDIAVNAPIHVGNHVAIGVGAVISTDTHEVGPPEQRLGHIKSRPLTIGDGAWIQRRVMLLGANVGEGAIVASGAVVTRDVPPNTLVGGVPARVIRELPSGDERRIEEQVAET